MSDDCPDHLLVVDDDKRIRDLLRRYLVREGFLVTSASDAEHARRLIAGLRFDLIILDVMMPGESGFDLTRALRRQKLSTPILILSARGEVEDTLEGFRAKADDYVQKPFEPEVLMERIHALLRRRAARKSGAGELRLLRCGEAILDPENERIQRGDAVIHLTPVEGKLLRILAMNAHSAVSRADIIGALTTKGSEPKDRSVSVLINRLREKVEGGPGLKTYLRTVRSVGYMLAPD